MFLGIDPGARMLAWARTSSNNELHSCGLACGDKLSELRAAFIEDMRASAAFFTHRVVCEIPQIYQTSRMKGDQNDLIKVAVSAGVAIAAAMELGAPEVETIWPSHWKGQRPKDVHNRYVAGLLNATERRIYEGCGVPQSLRHNILDAIGIAFWKCGRR